MRVDWKIELLIIDNNKINVKKQPWFKVDDGSKKK